MQPKRNGSSLKTMRNRVFIIGAGFSADAGIPLTTDLLGDAIEQIRLEEPEIFRELNSIVEHYYKIESDAIDYRFIDLSELLTILHFEEISYYASKHKKEIGQSEIVSAIRYYLSKVVAMKTPAYDNIPEFYHKFVDSLKHFDVVLSFNWDCLLESLLLKRSINFNHNFKFNNTIMIAKPHGSINWSSKKDSNLNVNWSAIGLLRHLGDSEVYFSNDLLTKENWNSSFTQSKFDPLIVLPGLGKSFDVLKLSPYWSNLSFAVGFAKQIFILGLGLPEDDFLLSKMLMNIFPQTNDDTDIIIVNPDPYSRSNYSFLLGDRKVQFVCEKLSNRIFNFYND